MASSQNDGVLVVGAGPTGLTMAILLMMQGVRTRIIDEKTQHSTSSRGTGVQARQLELLSFIGCVDEVLMDSTPPLPFRVYASPDGVNPVKDFEWSPPFEGSPSIPFRNVVNTSQASLESALRKRLQALGGSVELSTSLVGLREDEDYVAAETIHRSLTGEPATILNRKYASVVAADGAKGRMRSMVGVNYLGESRRAERMFIADVTAHGLDGEHWHRWGEISSLSCSMKPMFPYPRFQLQSIGHFLPEILPSSVDELQKFFSGISGRHDIVLSDMTWSTEWRANIRMVDMFSKGNVHFIGDAAHCHSPAGGQAISSSETTLFKVYSPTVHTLIVFPGTKFLPFDLEFASRYRAMGILALWIIIPSGKPVGDVAADKIFVDAAGHARSGYGLSSASFDSETDYFLVRPDGMIGAYGTGPGIVQDYFRGILRSDD